MKHLANLPRQLLHGRRGWLGFSACVACWLRQNAGVATELMGPAICRGVAALALVAAAAAPARSELPPWVYGDDQRRAPLVVEIRVERSQAHGPIQTLQAKVLAVRRQSKGLALRPGSLLEILFNRRPAQPMGWAGPNPIPVLAPGTRTLAWLSPLPNQEPTHAPHRFAPAAGGRSFGPSLEEVMEP